MRTGLPNIILSYQHQRSESLRMRPEEIYADQFAIEHASEKTLQERIKRFSYETHMKHHQEFINDPRNDFRKKNGPPGLGSLFNAASLCISKAQYKYQWIHDLLDPMHPSSKERMNMVQDGLARRSTKS